MVACCRRRRVTIFTDLLEEDSGAAPSYRNLFELFEGTPSSATRATRSVPKSSRACSTEESKRPQRWMPTRNSGGTRVQAVGIEPYSASVSGQRGRRQEVGPLKGHYKQGRVFRPPLLAYEATRASDWVRDDLPDLLWPLLLASRLGDPSAALFRQVQEVVIETIGADDLDKHQIAFDGRLTSIEAVPKALRPTLVSGIRESGLAESAIPPEIRGVLAMYEGVPGAWLLLEPFRVSDHRLDPDEPTLVLLRGMVDVIRDAHLNALAKCPQMGWLLLRGRLKMDPEMVEVLRDYPQDPDSRPLADSMILSSFLSMKGAIESETPNRMARWRTWAESFWRQNWSMFECLPEEQAASSQGHETDTQRTDGGAGSSTEEGRTDPGIEDAADTDSRDDEAGEFELSAASRRAIEEVLSSFNTFLAVALDHERPVDLHSPARHEVVCGLVSRAARSVLATLRAPHLWSGEHGVSALRVLSETTIVLSWMSKQDPSVYERFQSYGRGKAKLMKQHMKAVAGSFPGDPPELLTEAIRHVEKGLGGDWGQEFQEVNLEPTFSGLTVRQMAADSDLEDEYRHIYQSASGASHGEWWAIEDYAMQRCMNPLHLFHRIPSFDPEFPPTVDFAHLLSYRVRDLIELAQPMLFPDPTEPL